MKEKKCVEIITEEFSKQVKKIADEYFEKGKMVGKQMYFIEKEQVKKELKEEIAKICDDHIKNYGMSYAPMVELIDRLKQ